MSDAAHVHGACDGEVEGVEGCFPDYDEGVFFEGEFVEVDYFGGGDEIDKLADFGLPCCFLEDFDEIDVAGFGFEVGFDKTVDGGGDHEGVVDGYHSNAGGTIPAGLAPTGDG